MEALLNEDLFQQIDEIMDKYSYSKHDLIGILLEVQRLIPQNYIPEKVAAYISMNLDIPLSKVYDVISFYSAISEYPKGEHVIQLCKSTTCRVNKYQRIREVLEKELNIKMGETTTDGKFTLEYSPCFGACDISPAFRIDDKVYGNLDENKIIQIINKYRGV